MIRNFLLFLMLCGCASGLYPGGNQASEVFDEMTECNQTHGAAQFYKKCRYEFQDVALRVRVESVQTFGVNYISIFAEAGDPKKWIHCQVKGARFRAKVERLKQNDIIEIVGTPEEVSQEKGNAFIIFDECEPKI